jgi:hypothetical protein
MTISEYACEDCGYAYEGCGGLGLLMSGAGFQTISCAGCRALHDVEVGVNVLERLGKKSLPKRGPGRRSAPPEPPPSRESVLATLTFACPVDPSHAVRPWTDGKPRLAAPDAVISACPHCNGHVGIVRMVMEAD